MISRYSLLRFCFYFNKLLRFPQYSDTTPSLCSGQGRYEKVSAPCSPLMRSPVRHEARGVHFYTMQTPSDQGPQEPIPATIEAQVRYLRLGENKTKVSRIYNKTFYGEFISQGKLFINTI